MDDAFVNDDSTLEDLVSLWQRRRDEGEPATPAELCCERPELLPELERRIAVLEQMNALARATHVTATLDTACSPPHTRSGPHALPDIPGYEILGELGRGGMGIVYQARQQGLNRLVALKMILHADYAGPEERRRFRAEAESIARLRHPHIVQVYEVGEHGGSPYFSLEFCPGGSLAETLDGTPLMPQKAAALVEQLARASHAAHQAGIVHRDLKPANVLLTEDGSPRITDFGLAKQLDNQQWQTASGAVFGTASYMAPEQARGARSQIGPATDIYALGAILYELLTGRPPFKGATTADTLLQVVSSEPVPPRRLQPGVPRDLDTICLKCLQKQAARRYDSALALADDLARFQAGEPIRARPVGPLERLLRWSRRSPRVAGLSAAVVLLVVLLLSSSLLATARISELLDHERRVREKADELADRNGKLAEQERQAAEAAKNAASLLANLFQTSDPVGVLSGTISVIRTPAEKQAVRDMLETAHRDARQKFAHQPALLALLLDSIGNAYRSLGLYEQAQPLLSDALAIRRERAEAEPLDLAESLHHLAWWHHEKGDYEAAERMYQEALDLRVKALQTEEDLQVAASKFGLAWLLTEAGESERPERLFREVIETRRRLLGADRREVGIAQVGLAAFLLDRGRTGEAVPVVVEAARILLPRGEFGKLGEAVLQFQAGITARAAGWPGVAEGRFRSCLVLTRKALGERHIYVSLVLHELGDAQEKRDDLAGAAESFRECLEIAREQVGLTHPKAVYPIASLARVLAKQGRASEGETLFHELLQEIEQRIGKENVRRAVALTAYAFFLSHQGETERCAQVHQEADALFRKVNGTRSRYFASNLNGWAAACWRLGRHKQAGELAREALPLVEGHSGRDSSDVADVLDTLALALIDQKRYTEAEPVCQRALKLSARHTSLRWSVLDTVGRLHQRQRQWKEAGTFYRDALALARKEKAKNSADLAYSLNNLADVLAEQGQFSQAAPLFEEAAAVWARDKRNHQREVLGALCDAAVARLAAGEDDSYRRHCRALLQRIGSDKDAWSAERVGRVLSMRPDSVAAWSDAVTLTAPVAKEAPSGSPAVVVHAAVLYRAGRFAEARDLLRQQDPKVHNRNGLAAQLLLGLCDHHLIRPDAPPHRIEPALPPMQTQASLSWTERLFERAWRKEVQALRDPEKK
jgi:serine/threonine protein kinase